MPRGQGCIAMRGAESFHIAVTDINHHVRNFLQRELEKEGYTVQSVKTGSMAYERILGGAELDLIILDPEIFHSFDKTFIEEIFSRNSSLQIIIHTYADSIGEITAGNNIHLVEKDGQSIGVLKSVIRRCFELLQDNRNF
jgi:DNA-binding NtrC family response regulator